MARSTHIWVLTNRIQNKVLNAFTEKHELKQHLRNLSDAGYPLGVLRITRVRDNSSIPDDVQDMTAELLL
jgi:hypothetical protein